LPGGGLCWLLCPYVIGPLAACRQARTSPGLCARPGALVVC
jgi:hypothetical protein